MAAIPAFNFNSHARVGRDGFFGYLSPYPTNFNSHARVRRDDLNFFPIAIAFHFNSHARVGRDHPHYHVLLLVDISTHTPAWGVT